MNNTYPLYCVDRGDRVDECRQYVGPFTTHDEAHEHAEPGDLIRRCRQLRPSEIGFNTEAEDLADFELFDALADFELFDALADELDQAVDEGNLPDGAWYCHGDRAVHTKYDDNTLPTHRNYDTWVDDHFTLDAWICEGDE